MSATVFCLIPLNGPAGVRTWALVDAETYEWASQRRWFMHRKGYVVRNTGRGRQAALHREILGLHPGDPREGDHRNRDKLDNRRSNLRVVTRAQNGQNVDAHRDSTSRFRGVSRRSDCDRWVAQARANGENRYLGLFETEEEAAEVAAAFRAEYMPYSEEAAS